jgi:uncharacterized protein (DUF1501 family)
MADRMDGCRDCNRTELLRRAVAEAGRGLPGIEPGMPLPAGTGLSRRAFVSRAAGMALAVYGGSRLSSLAFDDGIAKAAALAPSTQRVLVSVFLSGGIDSLSVLFPAGDPAYYKLRPTLALSQSASARAFTEDSRLFWHPAAGSLATLHAEGKVSVLPAVGYANSDKSHFTSRHYYEVGATDANLRTGWMGRYLDATGVPDNPLQGLSLDTALHPAVATATVPVATLEAADLYGFATPGVPAHPLESSIIQESANIGAAHAKSADAGLRQAGQVAREANALYQRLGSLRYGFKSPVVYPASGDPFPHRLAGLAEMIAEGLPLRVVSITSPGRFDTHATQAAALTSGLQLTSESLVAFQRDLEARGIADRVLVHVWSEFGRRGAENASAGTDHGGAGIGFLIGTKVKGQQIGTFPGVTGGLDAQGNLMPTSDFRAVYAALLEQWLDTDANPLIAGGAAYKRPALLK